MNIQLIIQTVVVYMIIFGGIYGFIALIDNIIEAIKQIVKYYKRK